jgi:hypothetical protein
MLKPLKIAFGGYLARYFAAIVPTNDMIAEFAARPIEKAIVWSPGRMVDAAYEMLQMWQRNDTDSAPTQPFRLPVAIAGLAKDAIPSGRDYTRQVAEPQMVMLPNDAKERMFGLRTIATDVRAQVAFFAHEEGTARSLASQLFLFADAVENRRFVATYRFAGQSLDFPVVVEDPGIVGSLQQVEERNLTILSFDLSLHVTIPLFSAPGEGEENDGLGTPGTDDPAGYPKVIEVDVDSNEAHSALIRDYVVTEDRDM